MRVRGIDALRVVDASAMPDLVSAHINACVLMMGREGFRPHPRQPLKARRMMIDIFNHFMPKAYLERLADLIPGHPVLTAFPRLKTLVDVDARLRLLDEFDGLQQVLSLANPPLELIAPPDRTPELARIANDGLAEICRKHPDRFPGLHRLAADEQCRGVARRDRPRDRQLGARGIQVFTNVAGKPLSAPEFRPIFRRMAEHDLPVWVHPMRGREFPRLCQRRRIPRTRSGSASAGPTRRRPA